MENENNPKKPIRSKTEEMIINGKLYIVTTQFNENARETVEEKYLRYVSDKIAQELGLRNY